MLTPTDQPLDKLEDLTPDEMYVLLVRRWVPLTALDPQRKHEGFVLQFRQSSSYTDMPRTGWYEHFANKYIICGKLVNNDEA